MKPRAVLLLWLLFANVVALRANPVASGPTLIGFVLLPHLAELVVIYTVFWRSQFLMDRFLIAGGLMNMATFVGLMFGLDKFGRLPHGMDQIRPTAVHYSANVILVVETLVVIVEALAWYRLARCGFMHRSPTPSPSWARCFSASVLGNLTSFLVGHFLW